MQFITTYICPYPLNHANYATLETKDIDHKPCMLSQKGNKNIYLLMPTKIPCANHNPSTPFISSICLCLHHRILDINIITKFLATNNKSLKKHFVLTWHNIIISVIFHECKNKKQKWPSISRLC
jgi:hypothetical protein